MRGFQRWVALPALLGLFSISLVIPAHAVVSVTSSNDPNGACTQYFDSSSGVTVNRISNDCIIKFTSVASIIWTRPANVNSVRVLIVGGGGGGGANYGGGGGAGGLIDTTTAFSNSTATISVGGGGNGGQSNSSNTTSDATDGTSSSFAGNTTLTAVGGGGGGSPDASQTTGRTGGSGGGGIHNNNGGTGTTGQGNKGGAGKITNGQTVMSGGGGGAGQAGADGGTTTSSTVGGKGGDGLTSDITGSAIYYAGGGGAGTHTGSASSGGTCTGTPAQGGAGGGGVAGTCQAKNDSTTGAAGSAGTSNTGGGGGGGSVSVGRTSAASGGAGGSGIVIIRFLIDQNVPTFTSGSAFSVAENIATASNAATITTNESSTIVISGGVDSSRFSIVYSDSVTSYIRFISVPDYEAPVDVGANNVFDLTITATDLYGNSSNALAITITVTNLNESVTLGVPTISGNIYKGLTSTITITVNAAGKFRFFVDNKRLPNCLAVSTIGSYPSYSASCSWKVPSTAQHKITVTFTPTSNTFIGATSQPLSVYVLKRSTNR